MFIRLCYPLSFHLDVLSDSCASASFSSTVLLPGAALPVERLFFPLSRSRSLRSRFPCLRYYVRTTTAHCPSRLLLLHILPVLMVCSSFVLLPPLFPRSKETARFICYPPYPSAVYYLRNNEPSHVPI
jgi:hypothetical protein